MGGGVSTGDTCEPKSDRLKIVRKGMNPGIDSFGGIYDNRVVTNILEPTDEKAHWGLFHYFQEQGVTHVIHIGIADDFCVKDTSFAAASALAKTYGIKSASVVPSLSYGIFRQLADRDEKTPKDQSLIDEYTNAGVEVETEEEALARFGEQDDNEDETVDEEDPASSASATVTRPPPINFDSVHGMKKSAIWQLVEHREDALKEYQSMVRSRQRAHKKKDRAIRRDWKKVTA